MDRRRRFYEVKAGRVRGSLVTICGQSGEHSMTKILPTILLLSISLGSFVLPVQADSQSNLPLHAQKAVVDINRASTVELEKLPGIGPKMAGLIVAYRAKHGPFRRVEDLLIIKGMGNKKWKTLRPYVCVGCAEERK